MSKRSNYLSNSNNVDNLSKFTDINVVAEKRKALLDTDVTLKNIRFYSNELMYEYINSLNDKDRTSVYIIQNSMILKIGTTEQLAGSSGRLRKYAEYLFGNFLEFSCLINCDDTTSMFALESFFRKEFTQLRLDYGKDFYCLRLLGHKELEHFVIEMQCYNNNSGILHINDLEIINKLMFDRYLTFKEEYSQKTTRKNIKKSKGL